MFTEPCVRLPSDCSDVELGETILSALEHSQSSVPHPHPNQWAIILEPLMKTAGVSGWKTFANGAVCVHVEADGDQLTTIPHVSHGALDGFKPDEARKKAITVPASPDVIGAMVRAAIACAR
jgi:hypothetical protein